MSGYIDVYYSLDAAELKAEYRAMVKAAPSRRSPYIIEHDTRGRTLALIGLKSFSHIVCTRSRPLFSSGTGLRSLSSTSRLHSMRLVRMASARSIFLVRDQDYVRLS